MFSAKFTAKKYWISISAFYIVLSISSYIHTVGIAFAQLLFGADIINAIKHFTSDTDPCHQSAIRVRFCVLLSYFFLLFDWFHRIGFRTWMILRCFRYRTSNYFFFHLYLKEEKKKQSLNWIIVIFSEIFFSIGLSRKRPTGLSLCRFSLLFCCLCHFWFVSFYIFFAVTETPRHEFLSCEIEYIVILAFYIVSDIWYSTYAVKYGEYTFLREKKTRPIHMQYTFLLLTRFFIDRRLLPILFAWLLLIFDFIAREN